jgi:hypothetical protein
MVPIVTIVPSPKVEFTGRAPLKAYEGPPEVHILGSSRGSDAMVVRRGVGFLSLLCVPTRAGLELFYLHIKPGFRGYTTQQGGADMKWIFLLLPSMQNRSKARRQSLRHSENILTFRR